MTHDVRYISISFNDVFLLRFAVAICSLHTFSKDVNVPFSSLTVCQHAMFFDHEALVQQSDTFSLMLFDAVGQMDSEG